jgi:hypothetical protein
MDEELKFWRAEGEASSSLRVWDEKMGRAGEDGIVKRRDMGGSGRFPFRPSDVCTTAACTSLVTTNGNRAESGNMRAFELMQD